MPAGPFSSAILRCVECSLMTVTVPAPASAHHGAMFGPQSSAVLSPSAFCAQGFNKEEG
jgi:hypothetical protein